MPVSRRTRSTTRRQTRAPAPMTSTRPGCMKGSAARSARRIVSSSVAGRDDLRRPAARRGGCAAGSYAGSAQRVGGDGGDRAGQPHQRRDTPRRSTVVARPRRARRRRRRVAAATSAAVGGSLRRCRSVIRTQPMSTDRAASTSIGAADELGRPAAEVDDEVGAVDAVRLQAAGRAAEGQRGLLVPGDHLGGDADAAKAVAHAVDELGARCAASREAEVATNRTRSTPSSAHCAA